jgi:hypothetical protein
MSDKHNRISLQITSSKTGRKKDVFGRKIGVRRKIFHTFFSFFLQFLAMQIIVFQEQTPIRTFPKNHTKKPAVGFLVFPVPTIITP